MLTVLLLIYSVGISYYLIRKQKALAKRNELENVWQQITSKADPSDADIRAIARIARVRQGEISWFERSISTIGIVFFFSMLIATSIQTINSAKAEIESANLKQELKGLESQRNAWNKLIKELSEVIVLKQSNYGRLEKSEEEVLRQRLTQVEEIEKPDKEDEAEKLKLYLALKQYDKASALIDKSTLLADAASPETLIFLAEMSFLDGARARAKTLLKKFESELSKQPVEWQLRFFIVSAAISADPKLYGKEVAALKQIQLNEAEEWLADRVAELKAQARRRNLSQNNVPEQ